MLPRWKRAGSWEEVLPFLSVEAVYLVIKFSLPLPPANVATCGTGTCRATCSASLTVAQSHKEGCSGRREGCSGRREVRASLHLWMCQRGLGCGFGTWPLSWVPPCLWILSLSCLPIECLACLAVAEGQTTSSASHIPKVTASLLGCTLHIGEKFPGIRDKVSKTGAKYEHHIISWVFLIVFLPGQNSIWARITAGLTKCPWSTPDGGSIPSLQCMNSHRWTDAVTPTSQIQPKQWLGPWKLSITLLFSSTTMKRSLKIDRITSW